MHEIGEHHFQFRHLVGVLIGKVSGFRRVLSKVEKHLFLLRDFGINRGEGLCSDAHPFPVPGDNRGLSTGIEDDRLRALKGFSL